MRHLDEGVSIGTAEHRCVFVGHDEGTGYMPFSIVLGVVIRGNMVVISLNPALVYLNTLAYE